MSPPPRKSFPIPRELRDEIFSYLLTAEHVAQPRTDSTEPDDIVNAGDLLPNRPYDFSNLANIVSVNSTFAAEASATFYSNTFIRIQCQSLWLKDLVDAFQVPIIRADGVEQSRLVNWTMNLDISIPHSDGNVNGDMYDPCDLVILAKDMPLFCRALRWAFLGFEQTATMLLPDPSRAILYKFSAPNGAPRASIDIQLRSLQNEGVTGVVSCSLTPPVERSLLEPLLQCCCGDLAVSVSGTLAGDEYWTQRLRDAMSPSEVWMSAMAWQLDDAMADAHSFISDLYAKGRMVQIYRLVDVIAEQVRTCSLLTVQNSPAVLRKDFVSSITEPLTRAILMEVDIFAYGFAAGLRSSHVNVTLDMINHWKEWNAECSDNARERARYLSTPLLPVVDGDIAHPCDFWMNAVYSAINYLQPRSDPEDDWPYWNFVACLHRMNSLAATFPANQMYQSHAAVLNSIMTNTDTLAIDNAAIRELLDKLAVHNLDVASFKTSSAYEYRVPQQMKGWVDRAEQEQMHTKETVVFETQQS